MIKFIKSIGILVFIGLFLVSSCNTKNKRVDKIGNKHLTIKIQIDTSIDVVKIDTSISIIKKRLLNYGIPQENIVINSSPNTINIDIKHADNPERIIHIATSIGKFEFWDTYEFKEIYPNLIRANEILKDSFFIADKNNSTKDNRKISISNSESSSLIEKSKTKTKINNEEMTRLSPLFAYLQPSIKDDMSGSPVLMTGPEVGLCKISDTAIINKMLNKKYVKNVFPKNLIFVWKQKPEEIDSTLIGLIAIRVSNQFKDPLLTSEVIIDARDTIGQGGQIEISIFMNAQGAKIWKDITSRLSEEKRCIAMLIDGYVFSYPKVISEIETGHTSITGHFSKEEAEDIANIIKFNQLPIIIKTVECKITNE